MKDKYINIRSIYTYLGVSRSTFYRKICKHAAYCDSMTRPGTRNSFILLFLMAYFCMTETIRQCAKQVYGAPSRHQLLRANPSHPKNNRNRQD